MGLKLAAQSHWFPEVPFDTPDRKRFADFVRKKGILLGEFEIVGLDFMVQLG